MEAFVLLGAIGPWQIILIVAVVLLLFGGRKIPELMRGIGQGMKEFKNATKDNASKAGSDSENELDKGDA
jgi:sec-independent protein translocase protein TatA